MAKVKLTPRDVKKMRHPGGKAGVIVVQDGLAAGLELRMFPSGERRWSLRYRFRGRQRRLTLGDVENIPIGGKGGARDLVREALKQVANGIDPSAEKQAIREADTVGRFAETYMTDYAMKKKKSWRNDRALLDKEILPKWKHLLMKDITRRDGRELLKAIADRPAPIHANRTRSLLSKMWKFALQHDVVESNPFRDIERPGQENVRERVLTPDEIRSFWTHTAKLDERLRGMWRLRLLTAQRPQEEVAQMQWGELDLDGGWWIIPTSKAKNRLAHRVPLSATALEILKTLRSKLTKDPEPTDFVFAGYTRDPLARSGTSFPLPDFQPRDLRKTARTRMREDGIPVEWCEAILNHKKPGIVGVYDLYEYDREKRQALDHWARRVDVIVRNKKGAAVLPFAARA